MAKRKAPTPSPSPSTTDSDNIRVAAKRNVRRKTCEHTPEGHHDSTSFRTVDFVSIPRNEAPSNDELATGTEEPPQPYYERPLIVEGKRSRTQNLNRQTTLDFFGVVLNPKNITPTANRKPLARATRTSINTPSRAPVKQAPKPASTRSEPNEIPLALPKNVQPEPRVASRSSSNSTGSQNFSRSSSQWPRRSTARQSYVELVGDNDDDDLIMYETSSSDRTAVTTKATTPESDFGHEGSEPDSDTQTEEDEPSEESEPESEKTDAGYDSGIKIKRSAQSKKAGNTMKSKLATISGMSRTGRRTGKETATEMLKLLNRAKDEPRGLDSRLPPLSSVNDIFTDITTKAVDLGLKEFLQNNRRPLRVATMCSGTESPLLALEMVQDALRSLGEPELEVDHLFSAEIVPYKQAYIERNFHPKIIFRDITEIISAVGDAIPKATTAYGAKVPIPGNVDILIAGTSCVDFSRLNKHRKTLDEEAGGESSKTWYGVMSYVKAFRPAIVILENVKGAPYDHMTECYREIGYEVGGVLLDTKNYYLPQTRQRGYLVCFDTTKATSGSIDGMGTTWQSLMSEFRRLASSSVSEFMLPSDMIRAQQDSLSLDSNSKEYDWAACEIRHIQYRQDKRLGNARPLTFWSETGTMNIPENGIISWFRKRPERERDFMDIAFLRKATEYDVRYKTRIWDISQNVDLFGDGVQFGIAPCITPSGSFYASDAGRALAPEELLALQGLPLSKVSFTTETRNEIQDLAGNAMSTTAVGPAILAALICGQPVLSKDIASLREEDLKVSAAQTGFSKMATRYVESAAQTGDGIVLSELLQRASRSARRCLCEGSIGITQKAIQRCEDCGHTTCARCGGNPTHNYRTTSDEVRIDPVEFEEYLRSRLPQSLTFDDKLMNDGPDPAGDDEYASLVLEAVRSTFTFSRVQRTHIWTAVYRASAARLELKLDGRQASWQLFALPSKTLPVNSRLRRLLEQPIATAKCSTSLLDSQWQWRPLSKCDAFQVHITGAEPRIASWLARLELPDYREQQIWSRLHIQVPQSHEAGLGHDLTGTYEALPLCGTARDSLYKKLECTDSEQIYLLCNPTRSGDPKLDGFVFTTEKERLDFGIDRPVIASLDPTWTPWRNNGKAFESPSMNPTGIWQRLGSQLAEADTRVVVLVPDIVNQSQLDCPQAELVLECSFPNQDRDVYNHDVDVDLRDDRYFARYAHVLETMRRQLPPPEWQPLTLLQSSCDSCAPRKPGVRWMLTDKQDIRPYEDPVSAGIYERSIKSRPKTMLFQTSHVGDYATTIRFGLNLASLAHRAVARLPPDTTSRFTWKLEHNLASGGDIRLGQFALRPTEGSASSEDIGMSCKLFPKQALVLQWMQQQERGQSFTLEEAEEAIVPSIGWRAEVRAQTDVDVRGGICADHPGFGKTITSLALIHSHLSAGKDIVADLKSRQMKSRQTSETRGLLPTQATLIVSPHTLMGQWRSEIVDKLGYTEGVLTVASIKDLDKYSIKSFEKAKIILVNRTVLGNADYAERLANFAAVPGPATNSGRGFSQWLAHACKSIPSHLDILQNEGFSALQSHIKARYAEAVSSEEFRVIIPSRRLVGKDYIESKAKATKSAKGALKAIPTGTLSRPLFEQFYFNRIIIDEFHQYTPREYASLKALKADKRWGLSGTPALTDSYDIAQIADLLNVPLRIGSDSTRTMADRNVKALRKDMTDFERFDAMREMPSDCMHARIHEIAQSFLDTFVRQNVMDFDEMVYNDHLVPVTLDIDHQAAYTELSQQLASQEMNIRKAKKSKTTTRDKRFMAAIADVDTAEEALSRDAAFFERSGLQKMTEAREGEVKAMLKDLEAACFAAQHELTGQNEPLQQMANTLLKEQTLGDSETIDLVSRTIASTANPNVTASVASSKKKKKNSSDNSDDDAEQATEGKVKKARELTAKVNALAKGLLTSIRSKRYISNVRATQDASTFTSKCDSESCVADGTTKQHVAVSALCGHRVCQQCHRGSEELHRNQCTAEGCSAPQQAHHLLWLHKLQQFSESNPYGAKFAAAVQLLEEIRGKGEKAILFVQFPEQVHQASAALKQSHLPATIVGRDTAGAQIASFCKNNDTVLVLNASDETAAGSNIQAANHVIFLSPLLRDNQYAYDSTMAQAVGRVRRHGQTRPIHVYRICALHTIDVDILEHREHRVNALVEPGESAIVPSAAALELDQNDAAKGERVQLVREDGSYSLRPRHWLYKCGVEADQEQMSKVQGRNRVAGWEDFSSQVKFSRAFAGDV